MLQWQPRHMPLLPPLLSGEDPTYLRLELATFSVSEGHIRALHITEVCEDEVGTSTNPSVRPGGGARCIGKERAPPSFSPSAAAPEDLWPLLKHVSHLHPALPSHKL
jgi:hypothetical protein